MVSYNLKHTPKLLALITLILLMNCSHINSAKNTNLCYQNPTAQRINFGDLKREFILYIPESYTDTIASPLMINFHGFGGVASDYFIEADMRAIAEKEQVILAYPQGSCLDGSPHWNACPAGNDNKSDTDDFGFIEEMISTINTQCTIDSKRIYAVGYSNGGMMALALANHDSSLIAAAASVSGTMLDCTNTPAHPMPILILHGTSDTIIPYNGNNYFDPVKTVINYWTTFNNTTTQPVINSQTNGNTTIEHQSYSQGLNNVSVEHYKYINGEHIWFDTPYRNLNTAELIYQFVSKYDSNGLR